MTEEFVTVKGYKFYVKDDLLDLHNKGIKDIKEIEELEKLENLKALDLTKNKIKEIKGLEHLFYLEELYLYGNPLPEDELDLMYLEAQEVVKYCQEKAEKQRM